MIESLPGYDAWLARGDYRPTDPDLLYACPIPDCPSRTLEEEDWRKCESCHLRVCPEHLEKIDEWYFCEDCRKCETCGEEARVSCSFCGSLACLKHEFEVWSEDPQTGYREIESRCSKCIKENY